MWKGKNKGKYIRVVRNLRPPLYSETIFKTMQPKFILRRIIVKFARVIVNKTAFIRKLIDNDDIDTPYKIYFLSRPKTFGKTFFLSMVHEFLDGKAELFEGTAIASRGNTLEGKEKTRIFECWETWAGISVRVRFTIIECWAQLKKSRSFFHSLKNLTRAQKWCMLKFIKLWSYTLI